MGCQYAHIYKTEFYKESTIKLKSVSFCPSHFWSSFYISYIITPFQITVSTSRLLQCFKFCEKSTCKIFFVLGYSVSQGNI